MLSRLPIRRLLLALAGTLLLNAAPATAQDTTTYTIDSAESSITYAMEHPAHSWTGTSTRVSGTVQVDTSNHVVGGQVKAPVKSFDSGNKNRDSHMVKVVEFYIYPNVTFQADRVDYTSAPADSATVYGTLTFHGVERPIEAPVRIQSTAPDALAIKGTFDVTLSEFDLPRPSLMMMKVKDWIGVTLDLVAHPVHQAATSPSTQKSSPR